MFYVFSRFTYYLYCTRVLYSPFSYSEYTRVEVVLGVQSGNTTMHYSTTRVCRTKKSPGIFNVDYVRFQKAMPNRHCLYLLLPVADSILISLGIFLRIIIDSAILVFSATSKTTARRNRVSSHVSANDNKCPFHNFRKPKLSQ